MGTYASKLKCRVWMKGLCWTDNTAMEKVNKRLRQKETEQETLQKQIARMTEELRDSVKNRRVDPRKTAEIMRSIKVAQVKAKSADTEIKQIHYELESKKHVDELESKLTSSEAIKQVTGNVTAHDVRSITDQIGQNTVARIENATDIHEAVTESNRDLGVAIEDALAAKDKLDDDAVASNTKDTDESLYEEALALVLQQDAPDVPYRPITLPQKPVEARADREIQAHAAMTKAGDLLKEDVSLLPLSSVKSHETPYVLDVTSTHLSARHAFLFNAALQQPSATPPPSE